MHALTAWWNAVDPVIAHAAARALSIGGILLVLLIAYRGAKRMVDHLLARQGNDGRPWVHAQRVRTVGQLLTNVARWVILFVALVMVLGEFGVDVQALLVSAGVLGFAVGFGAQTLIRDVITGFFLLFEGLVAVGDTIEIGAQTGTVETIGLRVTTLRLRNGALRVVPNGLLTEFTRYGQGTARTLVEVSLPPGTDLTRAAAVLQRVGAELVPGPAVTGPDASSAGSAEILLTLSLPLAPGDRLEPDADLGRRIARAFEAERLPTPILRRVHSQALP